jgi:uncharacterized protein involved in exopolysaccharide biosynthesis
MSTEITKVETEDEISLFDIILFIQNSKKNIVYSTITCFTIGFGYYLLAPSTYEATATIQLAQVAGNLVESPSTFLEKIKLPLYFSPVVWQACDTHEDTTPSRKVAEKTKPILNKSAPFISFTVKDESPAKAKECLNAVITDIKEKQNELAKPILEQKKTQLQYLNEKLKLAEETSKLFSPTKLTDNFPDGQFASRALVLSSTISNAREIKDLRNTISVVLS